MRFLLILLLLAAAPALRSSVQAATNLPAITRDSAKAAQGLIGLDFSDEKIDMLLPGLRSQRRDYEAMRNFELSNSVPPAIQFNPLPPGFKFEQNRRAFRWTQRTGIKLPKNPQDLAYCSVAELAALIKSKKITSEKITRLFLARLKEYGPRLECVVTLTEDLALNQARRADKEIAAGKYRGPLHGIPYAAKDLLATENIPTTWGAAPFTNQVLAKDATVIQRLEKAGAVLIAKTTMGELAMGETWFGGMTRNPWNIKDGSSGSSAGTCSATAAGLIPFGIGTETLGSIVSPCDRCGVTGLRPTYGRVSRAGAMALSWSMDKIGPIARTAEDCALVFNAIQGPDPEDTMLYDVPFNYPPVVPLRKLRIGYLAKDFQAEKGDRKTNSENTLEKFRQLGFQLIPTTLPDYPVSSISFLLSTEGASAFDELTRSGQDDLLKQQEAGSWPNTFRRKRFVPAVEYLRAQRIRTLLIREMAKVFDRVDLFLAPSSGGTSLLISNLTGHPCVVIPDGFAKEGTPTSICLIGRLFGEGEILALAKKFQDETDFHLKHPRLAD